MVRDKHGAKMSKSKGNVIDPLYIIEGASLETLIGSLNSGNLSDKEVKKYTKVLFLYRFLIFVLNLFLG